MPQPAATKKPHLLCLIFLISFPSVSAVLISPALPAISDFFHTSAGHAQQLMTLFIVGYTLGQLIYSPLANRFGRKIAAYAGIILYLFSSLICLVGIYLNSFTIILIGRLLMALASSVGMIISFTIINDYYQQQQARAIMGYTVLAYAFMPALAITIGGLITTHLSWVYCFYFYCVYGVFILLVTMQLPETLQNKNLHALKLHTLLRSYYHAFSSWRLVIFSIIYGVTGGAITYVVASAAPFIGINEIGLTPAHYGVLLLIPYCGQFLGAFGAGKISKHLSAYQVITLGYCSTIFGSGLMFICFLLNWITVFSLMFPLFFIMMGLPMVYSNVTVMALVDYPDKASGSAVMSFITMAVTLFAVFSLTLLPAKNSMTMPTLFIALMTIAIIAFYNARRCFRDK